MPDRDLSDDELERMLRSLDPAASIAPEELAASRERVWARIQADVATAKPRRRRATRRARLWWSISLPAVAMVVAVLVVVLVVNPFAAPAPAAAQGLPPLTYEASGLALAEQLDRAREQLATTPGPAEPVREATTVAWYANIMMDGPDRGTVISPEVITITWNEDFDTRIFATAGRAYVIGGDRDQPPTREDLPAEGTVIRDDTLPGSDMVIDGKPLPFLLPGSGVDFYRAYLAETVAAYGGGAAEAIDAISEMLTYWTLTNEQEADLLTALEEYDGLQLRGITEDRAGRPVFGISAVSAAGGHEQVLLVSTESGRILGNETIYLDDDPAVPLPTGSVMSYQMWDLTPREQ